ncbi:hypothetical protein B0H11DRAFT_511367 [Mycena galericulata]|nr:hypothetical protein B0H11DRAFT_511367 [Mycena galericulata]
MSASHRNHSNKHTLPPNPTFLDFPRSDGDRSLWPQNTTREIDEEGCVNYMQPVGLDEPISIKWRVGVGDAICFTLNLDNTKQPYVLRDFPSGYRMFDHHKGKADNPRHDVYLFGSQSRSRFRSVPEFIPHAIWLMGDASVSCNCKYCSKKPQREITSSLGITRNSNSPSPSRPLRPKTEKVPKKEKALRLGERLATKQHVFAAVQKPEPLPSPHIQTKHVMLVERNNNLRDAIRLPPDGGLPRWFREGELVWVALQPEINGPGDIAIKYWPAIVDEGKVDIHPEPIPADNVSVDQGAIPWISRQCTAYKVQLLAISRSYKLPDSKIIPYQSHIVDPNILERMGELTVGDWDLSPEKLSSFDPCPTPPSPPPTFVEALTSYAVALQIASAFSGFWCLTDEWDAKLSLPTPATRPVPPPSSLQSAIEFAASNNAYVGSISSGPFPSRAQAPPQPRVTIQTRFQGLWWGGERIWADDLVRLKVPRSCFAPTGAQHIFVPSGPGPKSQGLIDSRGADPSAYGAISRGLFMKLNTIYISDGTGKRECRVAGMLYELAEADWEDPNLPRNSASISNGLSSSTTLPPSSGQPVKLPIPGSSDTVLPPPPTGYKFRPILPPGYEAVLSLSLISGRYYPRLLMHPLIKPYLDEVIPWDEKTMMAVAHIWALEGLFGGYKNAIDPVKYKPHREKMMTDASREAMDALERYLRDKTHPITTHDQMEVDS